MSMLFHKSFVAPFVVWSFCLQMLFRKLKNIFIGSVVIVTLLGSLSAFLSYYIDRKLPALIRAKTELYSEGKYTARAAGCSFSVFNSSASISHLLLYPLRAGRGPAHYVLQCRNLRLSGIDLWMLYRSGMLRAADFTISQSSLFIIQGQKKTVKSDTAASKPAAAEVELKTLKTDSLSIFLIRDTSYTFLLHNAHLQGENVFMGKKYATRGYPILYSQLHLRAPEFIYRSADGLYTFRGVNLETDIERSFLEADSLRLLPRYSKKEFGKAAGRQSSRVKLFCGKMKMTNIDLFMFAERGWFLMSKAEVTDLAIHVHRDKNVPLARERKKSVQELLRDIPFQIKCDSVVTDNAEIVYEHLPPDGPSAGSVSFNRLNALILNLGNDSGYMQNHTLVFKSSSLFMNKCRLNAIYRFPLRYENEFFLCSGTLQKMPLAAVNPMLARITPIEINGGELDSVSFWFKATEKKSLGRMKLFYHDLDVRVKRQASLKDRLGAVFFTIIMKRDNPGRNGKIRIADIEYERYPYKNFLYYTWKSLQSGIMGSLGVSNRRLLQRSDPK